jgi:hypothetical protein
MQRSILVGSVELREYFAHERQWSRLLAAKRAATSAPRKNLVLPQEKLRHGSVFGLPQDRHIALMCGAGEKSAMGRKCLIWRPNFGAVSMADRTGRIDHAPQMPHRTANFPSHRAAHPVMRLKCLNVRNVSSCPRVVRRPTAFSLPQRA